MTYFVSFRSGAGIEPDVMIGDDSRSPPTVRMLSPSDVARWAAGRDVLLAVHGFNVSYVGGINSLAALGRRLDLPGNARFLGVLWPGDFWIPAVNYPFEAGDAVRCGRLLAAFCDRNLAKARSLSYVSHSLGGRLVLEAVRCSRRRIRSMCLAAAAVDRDCLTRQYADALAKCDATFVLSSERDKVLRYAYPAGDLLSDLFGDSDSPFRAALGLLGPNPHAGETVTSSPIPAILDCDHGAYLSPGKLGKDVAGYMARAFSGSPQSWP